MSDLARNGLNSAANDLMAFRGFAGATWTGIALNLQFCNQAFAPQVTNENVRRSEEEDLI